MSILGDPITVGVFVNAKIVVAALPGATVTCTTPSGLTLTAVEISGTWTFAVSAIGVYTIAGTRDGYTATQQVTVSEPSTIRIRLSLREYLFKDGAVYSSLTGGWLPTSIDSEYPNNWNFDTNPSATEYVREITQNSIHMKLLTEDTAVCLASFHTGNSLSLSAFSKCCLEGSFKGDVAVAVSPSAEDNALEYNYKSASVWKKAPVTTTMTSSTIEMDLNNVAEGYIFVCAGGYGVSNTEANIGKIWVE